MKLIIASNNQGKIAEIKQILGDFFELTVSLKEANIDIDVIEDGETFEQNAIIKARAIHALVPDCAVLSDDSGLCVDALGGAPGVYSARYSGQGDAENNAKLLRVLNDIAPQDRTAQFVCSVCLIMPGKPMLCATGECHGTIAFEPRGEGGFGYDPLFISDDYGKSFAELSEQQKNAVSHRAAALELLLRKLRAER